MHSTSRRRGNGCRARTTRATDQTSAHRPRTHAGAACAPVLSKALISHVEHGRSSVSIGTLEHLADRLQRSLAYFVLGDPHSALADDVLHALEARAQDALARGRHEDALAICMDASALASARGDLSGRLSASLTRGEALLHLRRFAEAKDTLRDVLAKARPTHSLHAECRALSALGLVEQRSANYREAESLYRDALAIVGHFAPADPALHGDLLLRRGMVLLRMGQLEEACDDFQQGQRTFEAAGLSARAGEALVDHGLALHLSGNADAARSTLERAVVLLQQHEDLEVLSWARNNLGMVLLEIGRPREALAHFTMSLAVKRRLGDQARECHTLTEIARCHLACGEVTEARRSAEDAIALTRQGFATDEGPRAQIVLAALAVMEGNLRKAKRYLDEAAAFCEHASMRLELVTVYRELARVATLNRRFKEATVYGSRAFDTMRSMRAHDAAAAMRMAGVVARAYDEAPVVAGSRVPAAP
jgi:tetratricopeptide (TPR) repeat protein